MKNDDLCFCGSKKLWRNCCKLELDAMIADRRNKGLSVEIPKIDIQNLQMNPEIKLRLEICKEIDDITSGYPDLENNVRGYLNGGWREMDSDILSSIRDDCALLKSKIDLEEKIKRSKAAVLLSGECEYTNRYVVFLDILGFKEVIKNEDSALNIRGVYDFIRILLFDIETGTNTLAGAILSKSKEKVKYAILSDSVVVSFPFSGDGFYSLILFCLQLQLNALNMVDSLEYKVFNMPLFFRGGISYGDILHDDNVVFGPGQVDAYKLEDKYAKYPRIIIPEVLLGYGMHQMGDNKNTHVVEDIMKPDGNGYYYVDYLCYWEMINDVAIERMNRWIDKNKNNDKVRDKTLWLKNQINESRNRQQTCLVDKSLSYTEAAKQKNLHYMRHQDEMILSLWNNDLAIHEKTGDFYFWNNDGVNIICWNDNSHCIFVTSDDDDDIRLIKYQDTEFKWERPNVDIENWMSIDKLKDDGLGFRRIGESSVIRRFYNRLKYICSDNFKWWNDKLFDSNESEND